MRGENKDSYVYDTINSVLESRNIPVINSFTPILKKAMGVPTIAFSIIDNNRHFIRGGLGFPPRILRKQEIPFDQSICKHVVRRKKKIVISDIREHKSFQNMNFSEAYHPIAYAGVPVFLDRVIVGVLCVMDTSARRWTKADEKLLDAGRDTLSHLLGTIANEFKKASESQEEAEGGFKSMIEGLVAGLYLEKDNKIIYVNPYLTTLLGQSPKELKGVSSSHLWEKVENVNAAEQGISLKNTYKGKKKDGTIFYADIFTTNLTIARDPLALGVVLDVTEEQETKRLLKEKTLLMDLLQRVTSSANTSKTFDEAAYNCMVEVCSSFKWQIGHVYRVNATGKLILTRIWYFDNPRHLTGSKKVIETTDYNSPDSLSGKVYRTQKAHWVGDLEAPQPSPSIVGKFGLKSALAFPVQSQKGVTAILEFFSCRYDEPHPSFIGVMENIGIQLGRVLEREETENALRESEERYRLAAKATNDIFRDWNIGLGEVLWGENAGRVFRYDKNEIESSVEWWWSKIHSEDKEKVVKGIQSIVDGIKDIWYEEYRFLRGDGIYATVLDRGYVVRNEKGQALRVIHCMTDVTERRRSEENKNFLAQASALLESSLDFHSTLTELARLSLTVLGSFCIIEVRTEEEKWVTCATSQVEKTVILRAVAERRLTDDSSQNVFSVPYDEKKGVIRPDIGEADIGNIFTDKVYVTQLEELDLLSTMVIPLQIRGTPLGSLFFATSRTGGRRYTPVDILLAEDLSQRVAVAIEHSCLYTQAKKAIQARDEILAVVSHDLRNPLNTIFMAANILLQNTEERRASNIRCIQLVSRSAERMNLLIKDLLDVSVMQAGKLSIDIQRQSVNELVKEVEEIFSPLIKEKNIRLDSYIEKDVSNVFVDSNRIMQVFSNLLGNAIKFTPEGGNISIQARRCPEGVQFSVEDSGEGIRDEQLPHIFDRYWQAREGDRRGAGLGLAIAKGIVEAHGGKIWVNSEEGRGATFYFFVPDPHSQSS